MSQDLVNYIIMGFGGLVGFLLKAVWDAVKDLQISEKDLTQKVGAIELLVAGQYVKGDRFDRVIGEMFSLLRSIESKLDGKVDKTK